MAKEKKQVKAAVKATKATKAKARNGTVPTLADDIKKQTRKNTLRNEKPAIVDEDDEDDQKMDTSEAGVQPTPSGDKTSTGQGEMAAPSVGRGRPKKRTVNDVIAESPSKKTKVQFDPDTCRQKRRHDRGIGELLVLGEGGAGQLGLGEEILEKKRPTPLSVGKPLLDVCSGGMHTVCLTTIGEVYTFGCNDEGALGRDTSEEGSEARPGLVNLPDTIIQISAGDSHTAAMSESGDVYLWGAFRDSDGRMGLTTAGQMEARPLRILRQVQATKIVSGDDHLAVLTGDGRIFTCGNSEQGQLGRVAECFAKRGGRKGLDLPLTPTVVHAPKRNTLFDNVWAGGSCTVVRQRGTGSIYACGLNNYFQLGFPDEKNRYTLQLASSFSGRSWTHFAFDQHHTLAIEESGVVNSLGRKEYGRLGQGQLNEDCKVPTPVTGLADKKCVEVSCGGSVSFALTDDGSVYSWGMASAHLGTSDEDDSWEPLAVPGVHLKGKKTLVISCGGQHTTFLVAATETSPTVATDPSPAVTADPSPAVTADPSPAPTVDPSPAPTIDPSPQSSTPPPSTQPSSSVSAPDDSEKDKRQS